MKRDANAAFDAMAAAQQASPAVAELLDQADSLLDRLIGKHRSGAMTDRDAAVGVAVIAELRSAADKALRVLARGTAAGESITTQESER